MKKSNLLRKRKIQLLLVALTVLLPFLMTSGFSMADNPELSVKKSTLVYATSYGPDILDPAKTWESIGWMILSNCYDTLISFDVQKNKFHPMLATEVPTVENGGISLDGLTYRFHIRPQTGISAEDVEYSVERALVYDMGPSWMLSQCLTGYSPEPEAIINAVEVEGNDVIFHLVEPFAPFMQFLTLPFSSIVIKQWCIEHGDWPGTVETIPDYQNIFSSALDSHTAGNGPFILESWDSEEMVLVRNNQYWQGPAKLKKVILKFIPDWEIRKQMFLDGNIDILYRVPTYSRPELDGVEGVRVYTDLPEMVYFSINFNFDINPSSPYIGSGALDGNGIPPDFFDDIDIRKAFAHAFDCEGIIDDIYGGEALQPASPVVKGLPFHNPDQEKYEYNLSKSMDHFQRAQGGQVWEHGFTFTIPHTGSGWGFIYESLIMHVELINPKFHIAPLALGWWEFLSSAQDGLLPLIHSGWGADYLDPDNFVTPYMETGQFFAEEAGYSDSYVDDLIHQGRIETDHTCRQEIYYELQSIYHDEAVGIPMFQKLGRHYQRDWVEEWYYNPTNLADFYPIWKNYK